jgi:hypothetical protein
VGLLLLLLLPLVSASGGGCDLGFWEDMAVLSFFAFAADKDDLNACAARAMGDTAAGAVDGRVTTDDDADAEVADDDMMGFSNEFPSPL